MYRDDWQSVYLNQDRLLKAFKELENRIFLAGGTGLQRFLLPRPYRHSEDLDFFFPSLQEKKDMHQMAEQMVKILNSLPNAEIEQTRWIKEEQAYRIFCSFDDNDEIIKIELLNFTCSRVKDKSFVSHPFKIENMYNLLLYKLKALCDRPDTIKDLFDIYFILRELPKIDTKKLIYNLNLKFKEAIGYEYKTTDIANALKQNLKWDIELADIKHSYDLKKEIETFKKNLLESLKTKNYLDFSYQNRIEQNAKRYDLDIETYLELIELLDENSFWINEVLLFWK